MSGNELFTVIVLSTSVGNLAIYPPDSFRRGDSAFGVMVDSATLLARLRAGAFQVKTVQPSHEPARVEFHTGFPVTCSL